MQWIVLSLHSTLPLPLLNVIPFILDHSSNLPRSSLSLPHRSSSSPAGMEVLSVSPPCAGSCGLCWMAAVAALGHGMHGPLFPAGGEGARASSLLHSQGLGVALPGSCLQLMPVWHQPETVLLARGQAEQMHPPSPFAWRARLSGDFVALWPGG